MSRSIALVGPMATGKTTIANLLIEQHGYRKISMIGAFRELFAEAYPGLGKGDEITVQQDVMCRDIDCPEFDVDTGTHMHERSVTFSGRGLMQAFAPATRAVDNLFWNRVAFNRADPLLREGVPHVSDDVRFKSEATLARKHDFLIVRIETPRDVRLERYRALYGRYPTPEEESAPSEREIDLIVPDLTLSGETEPQINASFLAHLVGDGQVAVYKD